MPVEAMSASSTICSSVSSSGTFAMLAGAFGTRRYSACAPSQLLKRGRTQKELSGAAMDALQAYEWPGNIRELRNVLERALLVANGAEIGPDHLQFQFSRKRSTSTIAAGDTLVEVERAHIERLLDEELRSVERTAKRLGIPRNTLYYKMRKHGIRA